MPQEKPPESPTVVITQKMTAGKRALASRPPISTILSDNGIKVADGAAGSIKKKKKKRPTVIGDAPSAKKKKHPKATVATVEEEEDTPAETAKSAPANKSKSSAASGSTSAKKKRAETVIDDALPTAAAPAGGLASLRSRRKDRKKKNKQSVRARTAAAEASLSTEDACVVYIGHVPHGFYEREMRSYFAQFGIVSRLRLSRSRRTGASRGFAFVEFDEPGTAATAADAMDGYMMHGRRLRAALVPPARLHASTFLGANRKFTEVDWAKRARADAVKRSKNPLAVSNRQRAVRKKLEKKTMQLKALGIEYEMPGIAA